MVNEFCENSNENVFAIQFSDNGMNGFYVADLSPKPIKIKLSFIYISSKFIKAKLRLISQGDSKQTINGNMATVILKAVAETMFFYT